MIEAGLTADGNTFKMLMRTKKNAIMLRLQGHSVLDINSLAKD